MSQQVSSNAAILASGKNIGVADEGNVLHLLNAHHARQHLSLRIAPEHNTIIDFMSQFLPRHIRFRPTIRRNDPLISLRAVVDDAPNQFEIELVTPANHVWLLVPRNSIAISSEIGRDWRIFVSQADYWLGALRNVLRLFTMDCSSGFSPCINFGS